MKDKNQLIGCCGLDCETCGARIATITKDISTLRARVLIYTFCSQKRHTRSHIAGHNNPCQKEMTKIMKPR